MTCQKPLNMGGSLKQQGAWGLLLTCCVATACMLQVTGILTYKCGPALGGLTLATLAGVWSVQSATYGGICCAFSGALSRCMSDTAACLPAALLVLASCCLHPDKRQCLCNSVEGWIAFA